MREGGREGGREEEREIDRQTYIQGQRQRQRQRDIKTERDANSIAYNDVTSSVVSVSVVDCGQLRH